MPKFRHFFTPRTRAKCIAALNSDTKNAGRSVSRAPRCISEQTKAIVTSNALDRYWLISQYTLPIFEHLKYSLVRQVYSSLLVKHLCNNSMCIPAPDNTICQLCSLLHTCCVQAKHLLDRNADRYNPSNKNFLQSLNSWTDHRSNQSRVFLRCRAENHCPTHSCFCPYWYCSPIRIYGKMYSALSLKQHIVRSKHFCNRCSDLSIPVLALFPTMCA